MSDGACSRRTDSRSLAVQRGYGFSLGSSVVVIRIFVSALIVIFWPCASSAAADDETLLPYAVNVERTPVQPWTGYGIYLGREFFLTAAHVVGHAWLTRPRVVIGGQQYPTRVIKEGSFEGTDLTLLAVDESLLPLRLRLRRNHLCHTQPSPGEQVISVVPEKAVRSRVLASQQLPISVRRFSTVIADVANTGNSGSGVFDAKSRCLLGIMSRKISQSIKRADTGKTEVRDIAKYFVPASEIAAFLPADVSF